MPRRPLPSGSDLHAHSSGRALLVAFAAVACAFTLSTAAEQLFSARIRGAALEITGNSSPSIATISSMRSILRRLEVELTHEAETCAVGACARSAPSIDELRRSLRDAWTEYRGLPTFPGESERWPAVEAALVHFEELVTLVISAAHGERADEASALVDEGLKDACDRLDRVLADVSAFDRDQGVAVAARIERLARLSIGSAILLDVLSVALTIVAALLALRTTRQLERSLRERSEDLDRFAGRVAHDILSPLSATASAVHLARRYASGPGHSSLEIGERALRRVQRLVEDLLEFARAGAPTTRGASAVVRDVVDEIVTELGPMAIDRRIALRVEEPCSGAVGCATGVLTSIVSNLVRNAILYTGESARREVAIRSSASASTVRVEVEDHGPGIAPELGDAIFDPFVRGASGQPGSGLGLATAKRFVSAHGGRIGYASSAGAGTVFWFEMPVADGASPAGAARALPSTR